MTDRPESTDIHTGGDFVAGDKITYVSKPDLPLYVNVPGLPDHFRGRDELIAELVTRLCAGETTALHSRGVA